MLLKYDIAVTGRANVDRALAGIEARFVQHNQRVARTMRQGTPRGASTSANPSVQADREARQQEAYWRRAHQRSVDHRIRADERAHQARFRQIARESNAQDRAAKLAAAKQARAAEHAAKQEVAARQRFRQTTFGTVGHSVGNSLRAVGTIGSTALSLGGGFAMAGAIRSQMAESEHAARLANQAGRPELKGQLLREAQSVRGFSGGESLGAMEGFVTATGDIEAARKALPELSRLALAYGADLQQIGDAAGQAFSVLRDTIKDPEQQMRALNEVMSSLAAQGTLGAVEIRDMAKELAGLGAATRMFEGDSTGLLKTVGAMAQAARARGGAGSAAETTTAVTRFAQDLVKKPAQKALRGLGINVFSDKTKTKLRDPRQIMGDILAKTGGDLTQLTDIMNAESIKALQGFAPLFIDAEAENAKLDPKQRQKKGEAGRAALLAEFDRFEKAAASQEDIDKRVASALDEPAAKFKEAMASFNAAVGRELLPVVTRLIPEFTKLVPQIGEAAKLFGRLVEKFAEDPIEGIGKIIAAKLAFDLATAGIGEAVKTALLRSIPVIPSALVMPGPGAAVGRPGIASGLAGALAPAAAVGGTLLAMDQYDKLQEELGPSAGKNLSRSLAGLVPGTDEKGDWSVGSWMSDVGGGAAKVMSGPAGTFDVLTGFGERLRTVVDAIDVDKVVELQDADRASAEKAARQREATAAIEADSRFRDELVNAARQAGQELISAARSTGIAPNRSNGPSPVKS